VSADLDAMVQSMSYEDRRELATVLLYTALADTARRPAGKSARLIRRAMATLRQIKAEQPQPQPQNPT
jgi:hypothetical protein